MPVPTPKLILKIWRRTKITRITKIIKKKAVEMCNDNENEIVRYWKEE